MKISKNQLRKLVNEALGDDIEAVHVATQDVDQAIESFVERIGDMWYEMYDEGDPSMAALGRDAWETQVMSAAATLEEKTSELARRIENDLINGEFHKENY